MTTPTDPDEVFSGGREMGRVMAARDWAATPVGPPAGWPPELRSIVRILLTSRFSMWMGWGPELTFFYNDAYRRDTLRSKHPWALGRPAREVWAEIWDDVGPRLQSVLDTGEATWDEGLRLMLERSGYTEETFHTFSYSPLHDAAGTIAGFLCVVSEDTERVLGERRLRVLSELGDISAVTAPTLDEACAAAVAVLDRGRADMPFAAVYLVEPGRDAARLVAAHGTEHDPGLAPERIDPQRDPQLWAVLDSRRAGSVDGAVAMPLAGGGGGEPVGVLLAGINPYRALDREYRRFLDLVAGQVSTAIADASAYQLQRRRADELAELDRAKTAFFTGVSHELRTPLTLIAGPTEDALADTAHPLPPEQRARLEIVHRNSGRLRRLVDTILDFSRLEGGRAVADRVAVDLPSLTRGIAESFAPAITRAGLDFTITCPALPDTVAVDVDMWERIVLNLLSNAVKYTLHGAVTLALRPAAKGGAVLEVADTGIGIPDADVPLLFQRFHRVQGAAGRSHEGSGIGLALVAELVALHDGAVAVESVLGEGSRFTVTVPALPGPATPAATADRPLSGAARLYRDEALQWSGAESPDAIPVDAGATAGAVVLVAEDNADLRRFLAGLLEPHYAVLVAADGAAALDLARTARPDLVLTDVMMPGLDGFALLAALRTDPATATTPVIMLSARAGEEAAIEGLRAGADDYLAKPFSSADLVARVRSNLELARVRNHEAAHRTALINAMQDGLIVMSADGTIVETNAAFHAILGHDACALPIPVPHPWWPDPVTDPDAATLLQDAFAAMTAGGGGRYVVPVDHSDGRRIWVEALADSVHDPDGTRIQYVATIRDVTLSRRVAERDRLLADAGRLLAQPGALDRRLDDLVRAAAPVLGHLVVVLLAGSDGRLSPAAAAHHSHPERAAAALDQEPLSVDDGLRRRLLKGSAFTPADHAAGPDGDMIVPLVLTGRLLGCLVLATSGRARPHDGTDIATAEEVGRRLTLMIEAERLATRERQLHALTAALAAAGTVAGAARVLAEGVVAATDADAVTVLITRPGGRTEPVAEVGDRSLLDAWNGFVGATGRSGQPVWQPGDVAAHAMLPLLVGDRVVGALAVGFASARSFDDDERAFLSTLATEGGLAFERAALADTRRELADTLQRSLLPPELPEHPRLILAARYLPAASESRTGGDWYDVLTLDQHRIAIVVGDVVGQGPAAAAVMGQLRSALSAYLLQAPGPADALRWLDRYSHRVAGARASTAICVVLDTRTGDLRWARAGHPPPLVIDAAGTARYLDDAHGTVLGVRGAPPFTEGRGVLDVGGTVVLYTDGLVERRGESVDDGFDRLARAAAGTNRPVEQLVPDLLAATLDGAGPADDVALIVARLRPAPLAATRPAVPESLAAMRREVEEWAAWARLPAEFVDDVQLALGEAVANSVEHAYGAGPAGEVRYRVTVEADEAVAVEVADDGVWRPPGEPGFRGRGLQVIHNLSREFAVDHDGGGTRLRFVLTASPRPPAAVPAPAVPETDDGPRLVVSGELDLATVPALRSVLRSRLAAGPVVLDLGEVTYLSSAGIGLLLEAAELAPDLLRIVLDPDGPAARALAITGLDRYLPIDAP